jgi:uncharacterized protein (DUF58 family)
MPRPRRRALGLVAGAGILFFLGTNVQAGWLFVIAACLLGAATAGLFLPARMVRTLTVDRRAPEEMHQGDEVVVDLGITNHGRGMRLAIVAEDVFIGPVALAVPNLRPGERAEIASLRTATRRGPQAEAPVVLRSAAPFGVAERRRTISADGTPTMVLPAVVELGPLAFVRPASTSDRAIHTAPRHGLGPEYLGIREYRPGDSMRHVHWPSTARIGALMVRELEQEQTRRLAIVVDPSWDVRPGTEPSLTPLDRVCSAAASVAMAALGQGHGARLVIPGAFDTEVLARTDGREILRRLAVLQPDPGRRFAEGVAALDAELRGVETAVLVFPARRGNPSEALAAAVAGLRTDLAHIVAIPIEITSQESKREALPPGGWAEIEERLRGAGADVYPWRVGDDLAALLSPELSGDLPAYETFTSEWPS